MSKHKWTSVANLCLTIKGATNVLQIVVHADTLAVIALERARAVFERDVVPADGIGEHKHAMLGRFETLTEALQVAERFVDEWEKHETLDAAVCACGLST